MNDTLTNDPLMNDTATRRATTARDVMNAEVLTVEAQMTAEELAAFFEDNEVSGAPVVDEAGKVVGIVSVKDLVRAAPGAGNTAPDRSDPDHYVREWEERFNADDLQRLRVVGTEITVAELMTPKVFSVEESTPVARCAELMLERHIHRLLVTDGERLCGIVTSFDLLRLVAEPVSET